MANEIEKINSIALTSIESVNGKTDDNIEKLNSRNFLGVVYTVAKGVGGNTETDGTIDGDYK